MARRTKEEAEQTRKDIALAALEVFCEKGYSKTTFDEIAKRINLTKGAVYWHFRNKADILTAIIRKAFEITRKEIEQRIPNKVDSIRVIQQYLKEEIALIKKSKIFHQFLFFVIYQMEWSEAILNKVSSEIKDIENFNGDFIKQALINAKESGEISADIDIEETRIMITCLWQGIIKQAIDPKADSSRIEKLIDTSFDILIKGMQEGR